MKRALALGVSAVAVMAGLVTVTPLAAKADTGQVCHSTSVRQLCGEVWQGSHAGLAYQFTGIFGLRCITDMEMDWFNSSGQLMISEYHTESSMDDCAGGGTWYLQDDGFTDWSWAYPGGHAQGVAYTDGSSVIHTPFIYY